MFILADKTSAQHHNFFEDDKHNIENPHIKKLSAIEKIKKAHS